MRELCELSGKIRIKGKQEENLIQPILIPLEGEKASLLILRTFRDIYFHFGSGIISHIVSTFSGKPIFGYLGISEIIAIYSFFSFGNVCRHSKVP